MMPRTYDAFLEEKEFITAEEFLQRREHGEMDPLRTTIAAPDLATGRPGGFIVELDIPRYKPAFKEKERRSVFCPSG